MHTKVSFEVLLKLLKQKFHVILIWLVATLALAAVYTFYVVEPMYESTSKIVVNHMPGGSNTFTSTEINTNLSLIDTYQGIMMEPIILESVLAETDSTYTTEELRQKISFQTDDTSLIFGVTVEDASASVAAELANEMADTFQTQIVDILPVQSVTILSEAVPGSKPVSPSVNQNLFFGGMIGIFLGFMQILLMDLLDKRVRDDEIIAELDWVHLGSVNEISAREKKTTKLPIQKNYEDETAPVAVRVSKDS